MSGAGRRVECGGVPLFLREWGRENAESVLLLHGFTGDGTCLEGVAAMLRDEFRVIAPDLVGHGRSGVPEDESLYRMHAVTHQLECLLDALGVERVHVIGYSMGGRVALAFALSRPRRLLSVAAVGASAGLADATLRAERVAADRALADRIVGGGIEAFVEHWMSIPLFASQRRLGAAALEAAKRQRLRCSPVGLARSLRALGSGVQPSLHDELPSLAHPVLLVSGAEDAKFCGIAKELAAKIRGARSIALPEAGHAAHLENPAALEAELLPFLREATPHPESDSRAHRERTPASEETCP